MGISNGGGGRTVPPALHEQVSSEFGIDQMVISVERIAQALARMSPKDTAQLANPSKKVVAVFIAFGRRVVMRR